MRYPVLLRVSSCLRTDIQTILVLALMFLLTGAARADIRPYVYITGAALTAESTFQDQWLDDYTEWDRSPVWELGAGVRFPGGSRIGQGVSEWEFRAGLGYGRGDLEGAFYSGQISDWQTRDKYPFESYESYSFSAWTVRTSFMYNLHPRYGFSIGSGIEVAGNEGSRKWNGPDGYYRGGDAEDASTVRHGIIEVGGHARLLPWPMMLETFWIPRRVELNTKHIRKAENWKANFASFRESVGIRLSYQF